jgi:hypothetical protein
MGLLRVVERYLNATGTSATRFGRDVANDPRLVWDLRKGRTPGASMKARIVARIEGGAR